MRDLRLLLPRPDDGYHGSRGSFRFLVALTVLTTVRSLIHMFAPGRWGQQHRGLDVEGVAGDNLVHLFGQWGLEQLPLSAVAWVVILRYRILVLLALLLQLVDWAMRWVMGEIKPLDVDGTPPGGIGNFILVPPCAAAPWFALPRSGSTASDGDRPIATVDEECP